MADDERNKRETIKKKKASFHLPTETNPNPEDGGKRYPLDDEIESAVQEVEDEWAGSSFEGFYVPGAGTYRMREGPLQGSKVRDIFRRFFVVFEERNAEVEIEKLKQILERFRGRTNKNSAPIQESIYLE